MLTVKNEQGDPAVNIRDMEMSSGDQVLYATDMQKGLVLIDMSISGEGNSEFLPGTFSLFLFRTHIFQQRLPHG